MLVSEFKQIPLKIRFDSQFIWDFCYIVEKPWFSSKFLLNTGLKTWKNHVKWCYFHFDFFIIIIWVEKQGQIYVYFLSKGCSRLEILSKIIKKNILGKYAHKDLSKFFVLENMLAKKKEVSNIVKPESEVPKSKVPKSRPKGLGLTLKSHGPPPTHHPPHNF